MSGTQAQAGSPSTHDTSFLEGLDLMIDSLLEKRNGEGTGVEKVLPVAALAAGALGGMMSSDDGDDVEKNETDPSAHGSEFGMCAKGHSHKDQEGFDLCEKTEKSHVGDAADLGDKTNLPPEMGKRDEGSSIAEPMLRRREMRKAAINSMQRGIDLLKMMATVDKSIEKVDGTKNRISDIQLLKSFGLCECTNTEDIKEGTLIHKMLSDRSSRPSMDWWEECIDFAKSFEDMEEPAFFATFLYHKPDTFNPSGFFKGLNDTGGQVKHGRAMSRDTEIDENIGAMGGGAIDGLGMSDDDDDDEKEHHTHKA